jgi:hypothetical protein
MICFVSRQFRISLYIGIWSTLYIGTQKRVWKYLKDSQTGHSQSAAPWWPFSWTKYKREGQPPSFHPPLQASHLRISSFFSPFKMETREGKLGKKWRGPLPSISLSERFLKRFESHPTAPCSLVYLMRPFPTNGPFSLHFPMFWLLFSSRLGFFVNHGRKF